MSVGGKIVACLAILISIIIVGYPIVTISTSFSQISHEFETMNFIKSEITSTRNTKILSTGVQKRLESDMISQRDYYLLSVDIFKTLSLKPSNRPIPAKDYLEKAYNIYTKLIESSEALLKKIDDKLLPVSLLEDVDDDISIVTPQSTGRVTIDLPSARAELSIDE